MINKDTTLCISVAEHAGNFGCSIHNAAFKKLNLNYIYKAFSVSNDNLESSIKGVRAFGIKGVGVTMPHKVNILNYVDEKSEEVFSIGASNTVVNTGGVLKAYNTDVFSSYTVLDRINNKKSIYILGDGGFSRAVKYSADKLFDYVFIINRSSWNIISEIRDSVIFNCTPVADISIHGSCDYIDCLVTTPTGMELALLQASRQFFLYTGYDFPLEYIRENLSNILIK